jgi:hypothetical protein
MLLPPFRLLITVTFSTPARDFTGKAGSRSRTRGKVRLVQAHYLAYLLWFALEYG